MPTRRALSAVVGPTLALISLAILRPSAQVPAAQDEAQRVLAAARQALGGDAVLSAVKTFSVSGRAERALGRFTADQSVEIACELPDRFVRVVEYNGAFGAPAGITMMLTQRDGFNGTQRIRETISERPPLAPPPPPIGVPATAQDREARERAALAFQQQPFARLALAFFAGSFPTYPLEFAYAGQTRLDDKTTVDVVDVTGPGDFRMRLLLDAVSHLPALIVWQEKPTIMTSQVTTTTAVVSSTGMPPMRTPPPPPLPPAPPPSGAGQGAVLPPGAVYVDPRNSGDPAAGLPLVQHTLSLSDYRLADGLNWPHRLVERANGEILEDLKLGKFKVNGKIPASKFKVK